MTSKFYLRVMMAAMALLFAAVGCKDSSEEETPAPPAEEKYTFDIKVDGVTLDEAFVTVTPNKSAAIYYCSVVKKSDFDKFKSDAEYLESNVNDLKAKAAAEGSSFEAYLKSVVVSGTKSLTFGDLNPSAEYYVYVYGIATDGKVTSELAKKPFNTGLTFEFSVENITMMSADILVTPSNDENTYYFNVVLASALDGMTEAQKADALIELVNPEYLSQGPDGYSSDMFADQPLKPGASYYVFAVGYDGETATATSEPQMYEFTMEAPTGQAPDLQLQMRAGDADGKNTSSYLYCEALSEAAVSGKYVCLPKAQIDNYIATLGVTLEDIVDQLGEKMDDEFLAYLKEGLGLTLSGVKPSTDYTVIFKVFASGGKSTIKSADAKTTEAGPVVPSNMTFQVAVTNITTTTAHVEITPSNNDETYFIEVQPKAMIDENFPGDESLVAGLDEFYTELGYGGIAANLLKGVGTGDLTKLDAGTDYYVLVFGYTTGATTKVLRYKFTTKGTAAASADMPASGLDGKLLLKRSDRAFAAPLKVSGQLQCSVGNTDRQQVAKALKGAGVIKR